MNGNHEGDFLSSIIHPCKYPKFLDVQINLVIQSKQISKSVTSLVILPCFAVYAHGPCQKLLCLWPI